MRLTTIKVFRGWRVFHTLHPRFIPVKFSAYRSYGTEKNEVESIQMKLPRRIFLALSIASIPFAFGCGEQKKHLDEMSRQPWTPEKATWPELEDLLHNTEGLSLDKLMKAASPRFGGGVSDTAVAKGLDSPEFLSRLKKFEETPVPEKYKTPEREANKKELIAGFNQLREFAKNKDAKRLRDQVAKNNKLVLKIMEIPGQTPPPDRK